MFGPQKKKNPAFVRDYYRQRTRWMVSGVVIRGIYFISPNFFEMFYWTTNSFKKRSDSLDCLCGGHCFVETHLVTVTLSRKGTRAMWGVQV